MKIEEFQNRVEAQREVLRIINSIRRLNEQLMGLSSKAIGRWVITNQLNDTHPLVEKVYNIAGQLFFLATKSQTPIDGDYKKISTEVYRSIADLKALSLDQIRRQPNQIILPK